MFGWVLIASAYIYIQVSPIVMHIQCFRSKMSFSLTKEEWVKKVAVSELKEIPKVYISY